MKCLTTDSDKQLVETHSKGPAYTSKPFMKRFACLIHINIKFYIKIKYASSSVRLYLINANISTLTCCQC